MKTNTQRKAGIVFHTVPEVPWQYPAITERATFEALHKDPGQIDADYIAFPWATILDRHIQETSIRSLLPLKMDATIFTVLRKIIHQSLLYAGQKTGLTDKDIFAPEIHLQGKPGFEKGATVFTVCQHIGYKALSPAMKNIGITTCFSSHATTDDIEYFNNLGINLHPFPLFPVNTPAPGAKKDLLYSFIGMEYRPDHLSDIRDRIFRMNHPPGVYIKSRTGWHYDNRVYKEQVGNVAMTSREIKTENENTQEFVEVLARSRYSLCPSGTGPNNIRFWESLGAGSIPVLLSDKMLLPEYAWKDCIVRVEEKDLESVPDILKTITREQESGMRAACLKAFKYFSGDNIANPIRKHLGHSSE